MSISTEIHNKLISDFKLLEFEDGNLLFNKVQKYYPFQTMGARDGLIVPDSSSESTTGQSAGNTATTREYGFRFIALELIESSPDTSEGVTEASVKYDRLTNIQDSVLDYLQKEPNNLRSWGLANEDTDIFKIRVRQVLFDIQQSELGYALYLDIPFGVFLNVIPQNL